MKAYYWAILAALIWGVAPIVEKLGLAEISPLPGVFLRSMCVFVGGLVIAVFSPGVFKALAGYSMRSMILIGVGAICASIIGSIFFYHALKTGEASRVVPIGASFPLVSFILGVIFLHEGVTAAKVAGMALVIAGIYLLK